jgi:hypothetical protein
VDSRRQGRGHPRRGIRGGQCRRHRGRPGYRQGDPGDRQPRLRRRHGLLTQRTVDRDWKHARARRADADDQDRANFLPAYVSAPVYDEYASPINVSNQEWLVALEDELKRENGIPLFDTGDGYAARSMPSWNPTGDAVTFWESSVEDPTQSNNSTARHLLRGVRHRRTPRTRTGPPEQQEIRRPTPAHVRILRLPPWSDHC